jgi:Ca2+-binding RTX toxin-like protein
MANVNYIVGTSGDDTLNGGPGLNDITGGPGNDAIDATDGLNTINYQLGEGVDSVSFALPRTYQYADFLTAANNALATPSNFGGSSYSNDYFANADQSLIATLPSDISSTLAGMYQGGTVDATAAQAAFTQLVDWINAPAGNIIKFGPGITLSNVTVQVGATADFGSPQSTPVQFAVALNNEAGMVFGLAGTQVVAGDTSVPPAINMQFQFTDGTSATLADLLARPSQGVIGTQMGADGNDFLRGSLGDDTLLGNGGDDKLDGGAGADQLFGGAGNDVISGGSGGDTIFGEDGDDVMAAGKDGGFMSGGLGNDVYCVNRGDGSVMIDNQDWDGNGVDTISFGKDVAPSDLVASVDSSGHLTLGIAGTTDAITIAWFAASWDDNGNPLPLAPKPEGVIDRIQFFDADGTAHVYDLASLVNAAFPDPSAAADSGASVTLVEPGGSKQSLSPAGGDYARNYALTGTLFPDDNQSPTSIPIPDQTANQDAAFSYVVPAGTFVDPEGAALTLTATTANGQALPSWLQFDAASGQFSGTPTNSDVGNIALRVTATDPAGLSTSDTFSLQVLQAVQAVNNAPTVANRIGDQSATQGVPFSYVMPGDTFSDIDVGDKLIYGAKLADGSALPSWLKFDPATGTLSGTPANADVGALSVQITATDLAGASASSVFALNVANVNDAPTVAHPIADQSATQDAAFSFVVPTDTFSDIDVGDKLIYGAKLADGSALPSWLKFDPATGTLSGTPANADVGALSVQITATDSGMVSASSVFALNVANVNDAPTVANSIQNQNATQGVAFSYTVPGNTFTDIDVGDKLTYGAKLADGSALPSWLKFDPATGTLSGTPANADVGALSVRITAADNSGASASSAFALNVANVNDAPTVVHPIADQSATQGVAFSYAVPANTFADIDVGDTLTYSAKLADGSALPSWLKFDATTRTLSGIPPSPAAPAPTGTPGSAPQWEIQIVATDMSGASASDVFTLSDPPPPVGPSPVPPPPPANGRTITGTRRNDKLYGTSGDDTIIGGRGNDLLSGRGGNDVLRGGSGNDRLDGGAGDDYLEGGKGSDKLNGGSGVDVLQGGSGGDTLTDTSGNGLLDGGSGNDSLTDGSNNSMFVGGKGNDHLHLGGGYDIIAFNRGDGRDVVSSGKGGNATLSLGGGIQSRDLSLRRSGNDLILETGGGNDRITFEKWYAGKRYQAVSTLQVVSEAAGSNDGKIELYDFTGLVNAYDDARRHHPGLSRWTLTNAMADFQLTHAALGGDLAYQYGVNGTLGGIAVNTAQGTVGSSQFGKEAQTLHSASELKNGLVKLS